MNCFKKLLLFCKKNFVPSKQIFNVSFTALIKPVNDVRKNNGRGDYKSFITRFFFCTKKPLGSNSFYKCKIFVFGANPYSLRNDRWNQEVVENCDCFSQKFNEMN